MASHEAVPSNYHSCNETQHPAGVMVAASCARNDEEQPLLAKAAAVDTVQVGAPQKILGIVCILLLGEFISNADATLIFAVAADISSELGRLQDANWLSTAYTLGVCALQPMYGAVSDILGRKPMVLTAYFFYALGCIVCGIGTKMWHLILGRAISGIGGAGIMTMASVIITDLVPKRDIATWRSYITMAMTLGRSFGGPAGGWIADSIGWRLLFLIRVPLLALSGLLVVLRLDLNSSGSLSTSERPSIYLWSKLRQVDYVGSLFLATTITSIILFLNQGGQSFPWSSATGCGLLGTGLVLGVSFLLWEAYVAPRPIFFLGILRKPNVVPSYLIILCQVFAQVGMMYSVPLYFQVTQRATNTIAGLHLVPAVAGNALGAFCTGIFIKQTGRYKGVIISAGLVSAITYCLLFLRWNGDTNHWESLYIIPGGFGTGMAGSAAFISMASMLDQNEMAVATGGFFLSSNLGIIAGVTATNVVLRVGFKTQLEAHLAQPNTEIIRKVMSDVNNISRLQGTLRVIVVQAYVTGLNSTYLVSLSVSVVASLLALLIRNHAI